MLASSKCLLFCSTRSVAHLFSHHSFCRIALSIAPLSFADWVYLSSILLIGILFHFQTHYSVADLCQGDYYCRNSISTLSLQNQDHLLWLIPLYSVWLFFVYRATLCREHFRYLEHRSSLCNSATSRSISSLILPLDFVLVFYCSTMISRHNRVGTLFFATAEFIFDDWHRFLGVLIGQPCWSAHCPLSAQYTFGRNTTPLSVILYATLLNTTNFLLSIETTQSHIPHLHL